jgi:RNAse (barnase) inhibitor barstar
MKLINTIEFSPFDYTNNDYEFPNCSKKENPKAWDDFWQKCLADSQLTNLAPIEQGAYLVDIETLSDFELQAVVKNELKDLDDDLDYEEQISSICGGIVLQINGEFVISPSCCGDLSDLTNWENMLHAEHGQWHQLWIGHPWLYYKRHNNIVEFSDYYEENLDAIPDIQTKYKVNEHELETALKAIIDNQNKLKIKISRILQMLNMDNADKLANIMVGV